MKERDNDVNLRSSYLSSIAIGTLQANALVSFPFLTSVTSVLSFVTMPVLVYNVYLYLSITKKIKKNDKHFIGVIGFSAIAIMIYLSEFLPISQVMSRFLSTFSSILGVVFFFYLLFILMNFSFKSEKN